MIDLDEIFLNMLKIFLIEFKFLLLYYINWITPGHYKKKLFNITILRIIKFFWDYINRS